MIGTGMGYQHGLLTLGRYLRLKPEIEGIKQGGRQ